MKEKMKKSFIQDIKVEKTKKALNIKCKEIIDSLNGFNLLEKYIILKTLIDSFVESCEEEGLGFMELKKKWKKKK
ncbi:MAG TPA: hypothetical protein ENI23_15720 [bacterium]|nr:hypothetical protein [bacterium]